MTKQLIDIGDINIGDHCTHCGINTSFKAGNGMFVNRIPSGADGKLELAGEVTIDVTVDGYMCSNCQLLECDLCGNKVLDYVLDGRIVCLDCLEKEKQEFRKWAWKRNVHRREGDND